MNSYLTLAESSLHYSRKSGATHADVYIQHGETFSVQVINGSIESLTQSFYKGLGLRVFIGNKTGFSFTTDFSQSAVESMIHEALELAKLSDADAFNVLPDKILSGYPELKLFDPQIQNIRAEDKIALARSLEEKVLQKDPRIRRTEGASFSNSNLTIHLLNSKGSSGSFTSSLAGMSVSPVAEENGIKSSESAYHYNRFFDKLDDPDTIAVRAAERTVRLLGARKIKTTQADIVLDPSCGVTFLSGFFSLINGDQVNRGLSCLKESIGKRIAPDFVTIVDNGSLPSMIGSRPFDGEGIGTSRQVVVGNGVLKKFLFDTKAALRAGADSTGHAHRAYDSEITIGVHNFYMEGGPLSPEQIISETSRGLWVTKLMGFGFDPVSGMFSFGAAGLWIEKGSLTYPVHEIVIAANMRDMLMHIRAVGNDLEFRSSISCPTLKISDVTIGGY